MENYVNHVTAFVILRDTVPITVQYSCSSVIPCWARINPDESHFWKVSLDHGWGVKNAPNCMLGYQLMCRID